METLTITEQTTLDTFRAECRQETPRDYAPTFNSPADNGDWCVKDLDKSDDAWLWLSVAADDYKQARWYQHAAACKLAIGG